MPSVRKVAECHKLDGSFWVVRDLLGYVTGAPEQISLSKQRELLHGHHVHLTINRVGVELFDAADDQEIDQAVAVARDLYSAADFGIYVHRRRDISLHDANGMENIGSASEAQALTEEFATNSRSIQIYFVQSVAGSAVEVAPGDASTDGVKGYWYGAVVGLESDPVTTGFALARGIGKFLSLVDHDDPDNLMYPTLPNGGQLTARQRNNIREDYNTFWNCDTHIEIELTGGHW